MEDLDIYIKRKLKEYKKNLKKEEFKPVKEVSNKTSTPEYKLWANAKYRSIKKGIPFDITPEDIIVPDICPYLKVKFTKSNGDGIKTRYSPSLDRIIPAKGYVKGNIQVISWLANTMKNHATPEELLAFATSIINNADLDWYNRT